MRRMYDCRRLCCMLDVAAVLLLLLLLLLPSQELDDNPCRCRRLSATSTTSDPHPLAIGAINTLLVLSNMLLRCSNCRCCCCCCCCSWRCLVCKKATFVIFMTIIGPAHPCATIARSLFALDCLLSAVSSPSCCCCDVSAVAAAAAMLLLLRRMMMMMGKEMAADMAAPPIPNPIAMPMMIIGVQYLPYGHFATGSSVFVVRRWFFLLRPLPLPVVSCIHIKLNCILQNK